MTLQKPALLKPLFFVPDSWLRFESEARIAVKELINQSSESQSLALSNRIHNHNAKTSFAPSKMDLKCPKLKQEWLKSLFFIFSPHLGLSPTVGSADWFQEWLKKRPSVFPIDLQTVLGDALWLSLRTVGSPE